MPLKYEIDSLDTVPESLHSEYTQQEDGKFRLVVDGLDDATGLKRALQAERSLNRNLKNGKTADEIAAALAKAAEPPKDSEHQANFAKTLEQREQAWGQEKGALEMRLAAAETSERTAIKEAVISTALSAAKVTPEGIDLLPARLADRLHYSVVNSKRQITIMEPDGITPMTGTGKGGAATIADLIGGAMRSYPSLFQGRGAGGGGKNPGEQPRTRTTITRRELQALPAHEHSAAARKFTIVD